MILSALVKVGKISLKARHGVHRDVIPVPEASGENNFCFITDGAGITGSIIGIVSITLYSMILT